MILHNPAREEDFTNKRVVFDRWSGRPFKLIRNEQVAEFVLVHETAVLAVIEKERKMTREDLIAEYTKRINDTIENSRELNDDDVDKLNDVCDFSDIVDELQNAEDDGHKIEEPVAEEPGTAPVPDEPPTEPTA